MSITKMFYPAPTSDSEKSLLLALYKEKQATGKKLSTLVKIEHSNASLFLKRMREKGIIQVHEEIHDSAGRQIILELTAYGKEIAEAVESGETSVERCLVVTPKSKGA